MSLKNRPYIGSYQLSNQTLVRHAPDTLVLINGFAEFAVCSSCNKEINFQQYITNVSVDATVDPISTANLTLSVPRHASDVFGYDGNYVLKPALEVVILQRGYFPMKGYAGRGQEPSEGGFNANDVPVYPYYQVFRGVVTNVTHDYSGGFYTATVQCANLLHFWQNLKLSVNGAVFGPRPDGSLVQPSLVGHKFTSMNPYAIIYSLVKVGFGAAFGVDFVYGLSTNVAAVSDDGQTSLFAHAAEWWERRWTENSGSLRMYGIDGAVFDLFEQAYLGAWYDTRKKAEKGGAFYHTAKTLSTNNSGTNDYDWTKIASALEKARTLRWDKYSTNAAVYASTDSEGNLKKIVTEDILRMQAFVFDIGKVGSINNFETEYMSKLEIVEAVKTITGYEFYQDVDGDLVFKPPMYNMDTREDPVYRIEDRDLISISETETEPEATMMKGTGSHFSNVSSHGVSGWMGVGGVFIDYRLVAKFGYKEETFEANWMNNRQAIYLSAVNRLDLANAGVNSSSITIPLRPEMRPGYPVYVVSLDCFFYVRSLSHSWSPGATCTTTIQGIAKRAKWLPPMQATGDGILPGVSSVRLDAPGEFPSRPLFAYPQGGGPPRVYGFPNVVMALDGNKVNMATVDVDRGTLAAEYYVQIALQSGFIQTPDNGETFLVRSSQEGGEPFTLQDIQREYRNVADALKAGDLGAQVLGSDIGKLIQAVEEKTGGIDTPNSQQLLNYLALQTSLKSSFNPGVAVAGKYRYYSCSHPDEAHQGPVNLEVDSDNGDIEPKGPGPPDEGFTEPEILIFKDAEGDLGGIQAIRGQPTRGIKIANLSQKGDNSRSVETESSKIDFTVVRTADIRFITFGPQLMKKKYRVSLVIDGEPNGYNFGLSQVGTTATFTTLLIRHQVKDPSVAIEGRLKTEYARLLAAISTFSVSLGVAAYPRTTEKAAQAATIVTAFKTSLVNPYQGVDPTVATINDLRKQDTPGIAGIAESLANVLYAYVQQVVVDAKNLVSFSSDARGGPIYLEFMGYRAVFVEEYTDGTYVDVDAGPAVAWFNSDTPVTNPAYTPIFPVSDKDGYEVFGNLPYGRGVTITKYAELLQSTTEGPAGLDGAEAAEQSFTSVGSGGSNASSMFAIELFYAGYLLRIDSGIPGADAANSSLAALADPHRAAVLARLNTTAEGLAGAVEAILAGARSGEAKVRNNPVTSFFRGQSVLGKVAATQLANLDILGATCVCKGVEQAFFLQAFSQEFAEIFTDPVQGFADLQAFNVSEAYKASRDALAGRTLDVRNTSLAAEFEAQANDILTDTGNLAEGLRQADADRIAAQEQAAANFADIADDNFDNDIG